MDGDIRRTSISLSKELYEKGLRIAKKRHRNFSNYVADLIASDKGAALAQPKGEFRGGRPKKRSESASVRALDGGVD